MSYLCPVPHQFLLPVALVDIKSFDEIIAILKPDNIQGSKLTTYNSDKLRKQFLNKLYGENINFKETLTACESYIPQILGLVESFSAKITDADQALETGITFVFTSGFLDDYKKGKVLLRKNQIFSQTSLQFELLMAHWMYGYLLMNFGENLLKFPQESTQQQIEEFEKEATNCYRLAAGVFEYLHNSISVYNQIGLNITAPGFPETFSVYPEMLMKYCVTIAQIIAIKTAIHKNKSPIVIAKLSIAVYKSFDKIKVQYDELQKLVSNVQHKGNTSNLDLDFLTLVNDYRVFFRAFSLKYLSLDYEKKDINASSALIETGLAQIKQMNSNSNTKFVEFSTLLQTELEELKEKFKVEGKVEKDIKEMIPDGIMLMKPSPLNIKSAFKTL